MKVGPSRRRPGPISIVSAIVAIFIVLIVLSEASAGILGNGLLTYYLQGRSGPFDGAVVSCPYNYNNLYFEINEIPIPSPVCPYGAPIGNKTYTNNVPGVQLYPVYKGEENVLLESAPANTSLVVSLYGLGYSQTMDKALESALVSGALPNSNSTYQAVVTDTLAKAYGLEVGEQFTISGSDAFCTYLCQGGKSFPWFNPGVLGDNVTISGILSTTLLNSAFNLDGVPVFVGDGAVYPTSVMLGYRLPALYGLGQCVGPSWLPEMWGRDGRLFNYTAPAFDTCTVGPEMFAIVSNNLFSDFFNHFVAGPNEILFHLEQPPATPSALFATLDEIQNEYSGLPAYGNFTGPLGSIANYTETSAVYLDWRSTFALVWEPATVGLGNVVSVSPITSLAEVPQAQPPGQVRMTPIVAIEQSQVVNNLQAVVYGSSVLALDTILLGAIVEVSVFLMIRRKLLKEIEIYKSSGLSRAGALRLLLGKHAVLPSAWIVSAVALSIVSAVLFQSGVVLPLVLGSSFLGLMVLEFAVSTYLVYRYAGFKHVATGRAG